MLANFFTIRLVMRVQKFRVRMLVVEFGEVAMHGFRMAAFGFQLNGEVLDLEFTGHPVADRLEKVGREGLVAALDLYGGPAIIIDFGTATTFDCVSAKGEYLGGAIAPGMQISAHALFDRAAKLPRAELFVFGRLAVRKRREVERVQARLARERQFNRKVALNATLRQLKAELEALSH